MMMTSVSVDDPKRFNRRLSEMKINRAGVLKVNSICHYEVDVINRRRLSSVLCD